MFRKPMRASMFLFLAVSFVGVSCRRRPTPAPERRLAPSPPTTSAPQSSTPKPKAAPERSPKPTTSSPADPSKYGFESDIFWMVQTYKDSQACTAVERSDKDMAKSGCYSLRISVDLVGGHSNKSKGEAFVDMRYYAPTGIKTPLNLEGRTITAWVYVPRGAAGEISRPNGVQVFVKDQGWKSEYGTWFDLIGSTERWIAVSLMPSRQPPPNGYMERGFDPTRIISVGLKIGTGDYSQATYKGPIYVDAVDW